MKIYAHHQQQHTAHALRGKACNNCLNMCVIHRGRKIPKEEYWCDRYHQTIEPLTTCEKRRDAS